jgi:Rrf2 family nitric oxide-sensitive transcriptional repressor
MRLNKSTRHAIRILVDCARSGDQLVKVADLSSSLDITPQNVFKIVHLLSRAGLVAPSRGRYGGVRLARPASEIRIGEVVRALEMTNVAGSDPGVEAAAGDAGGPSGVNKMLDEAVEAFVTVLNQHTLADMAAGTVNYEGSNPKRAKSKRSAKTGIVSEAHNNARLLRGAATTRGD